MNQFGLTRSAVARIACAVVASEVRYLRGTHPTPATACEWPDGLPIGDEGLGLDSIEQLGALGALAETFDLDDTLLHAGPPQRVDDWIDWIMRRHATPGGSITVRTSGSTGAPRTCSHAVADLIEEAAWFAARLADRRRVVALVPADHLYGIIWTALLPASLDVPVVARTIGAPLDLIEGDLVVAVPEQWRALSRMTRFPDDVIGVSSAGPFQDAIAGEVFDAGLARLIDVYGSSETGAIAWRDVPAACYEIIARWNLVPHDDDRWRLEDRSGRRAALPDHIDRTGSRSLRIAGRRDGAVQIAGHNVWPEQVADILRGVEGVSELAVRLHANGRLKAFVVPRAGLSAVELQAALERTAIARLRDHERPRSLRFGDSLPRNAMGKLEDWS